MKPITTTGVSKWDDIHDPVIDRLATIAEHMTRRTTPRDDDKLALVKLVFALVVERQKTQFPCDAEVEVAEAENALIEFGAGRLTYVRTSARPQRSEDGRGSNL